MSAGITMPSLCQSSVKVDKQLRSPLRDFKPRLFSRLRRLQPQIGSFANKAGFLQDKNMQRSIKVQSRYLSYYSAILLHILQNFPTIIVGLSTIIVGFAQQYLSHYSRKQMSYIPYFVKNDYICHIYYYICPQQLQS